ncbi:hypothetical protein CJU89_5689 [Yarrowia sp. B02]|nr:hypothetical protein CJU89_5689 [Yarrowia sp. B02]
MTLTRQQVLEQFSNDDHVSHQYLDVSLPKCEEKNIQQLQSSASNLLSQLDYHSQDLTWTLDGLLTKLTQSQNKIRYQIELLTGDLDSLRTRVESVETKSDSNDKTEVKNDTNDDSQSRDQIESRDQLDSRDQLESHDLEAQDITARLQKYDSARRKMENVIITLRKAKEYDQTKLDAEIETLISQQQYEKALTLVDEALQLAQVWKGTGSYNSRVRAIMASKKNIERELSKQEGGVEVRESREPSEGVSTKESSPMPEGFSLFGELSRRMGY